MSVSSSILDLIGHTPLIQLRLKKSEWQLFLKMEKFNPGLSMKDRMALNMINQAEKEGLLKPGGTIIESSSGNTAIGLAIVAALRGYKFIAIVDHHAAKEKLDIIRAYGGETIFVAGQHGKGKVAVTEREHTARKLSQETPNSFFPGQADNLNNRIAYTNTLAQELIDDLGVFEVLIGSIGTGGSLSGTAEGVKQYNPKTKIIAVEPVGSTIFNQEGGPYLQSGTGNPVGADIPKNVNFELIDYHLYASDSEAFLTCRYLARHKGILVGGSAGGVIYKAVEFANQQKGSGKIAAIIPDGGEKYITTIFNDGWIKENLLLNPQVETYLRENI